MSPLRGCCHASWIPPTVLLASRFGEWAGKVSKTKDYMQEQTPTFAN
jgi:hypothetical protein